MLTDIRASFSPTPMVTNKKKTSPIAKRIDTPSPKTNKRITRKNQSPAQNNDRLSYSHSSSQIIDNDPYGRSYLYTYLDEHPKKLRHEPPTYLNLLHPTPRRLSYLLLINSFLLELVMVLLFKIISLIIRIMKMKKSTKL